MDKLLSFLQVKPKLYEKTQYNIWDNDYVSKGMLQAHLDESLDSASRNIKFVNKSVNWISELFPPTKYHNLLDLGCGPGIYTERFYNRGYYVTGIDISKRSIMYAKQSAMKNNMNIDYILNSYIEYEFQKTFDLVTLIYCDYGVLSPQERHTLLKKVYHVLSQQGVFIFDVFTPAKYYGCKEERSWEAQDNGFWSSSPHLLLHSFYCYSEQNTYLNQYVVITEDEICHYNVWEHAFTVQELKNDLEAVGFQDISFYGNFAVENNCQENKIWVVAIK